MWVGWFVCVWGFFWGWVFFSLSIYCLMLLSILLFKYQSQKKSIQRYLISTQCDTRLAEVLPKYYDVVPWSIASNSLSVSTHTVWLCTMFREWTLRWIHSVTQASPAINRKKQLLFDIPQAAMKSDFITPLYHQSSAFHCIDVFINTFAIS